MSVANDYKSDIEWKTLDPSKMPSGDVYRLAISAVVPRPVAVITSVSSAGTVNCAPFSYTSLLSHDPPMVCHGITVSNNGAKKKDTLVNIEATKEWVFNVLSDNYLDAANQCSASYDSNVNEMDETDLIGIPSEVVQAPRIAVAKVAMECELDSTKEILNSKGIHTTTVVFGRVVRFHVHSSVLKHDDDGKVVIDLENLRAVGRAGDISYWPTGEGTIKRLVRPK